MKKQRICMGLTIALAVEAGDATRQEVRLMCESLGRALGQGEPLGTVFEVEEVDGKKVNLVISSWNVSTDITRVGCPETPELVH